MYTDIRWEHIDNVRAFDNRNSISTQHLLVTTKHDFGYVCYGQSDTAPTTFPALVWLPRDSQLGRLLCRWQLENLNKTR